MGILTTIAFYQTAIFYYVLGGVTFVPLCALTLVVYFWLTAPLAHTVGGGHGTAGTASSTGGHSLADVLGTEGEFSEERKRKALDLAVWNRDAQNEEDARKARENDGDDAIAPAIPAAARRLKPAPAQPRRPHRAGWLTVRRHFQSEGVNLALQQAAAAHQQAAARQSNAASAGNGTATHGVGTGTDAKGQGYMSSLYRGMLNYRSKNAPPGDNRRTLNVAATPESGRSTPEHALDDAAAASAAAAASSQPSTSSPSTTIYPTAAKETFYCILKGPILYLYSNADPSSPDTEVHAAIDLRNKRTSIYIAGVGDTIGEPEDTTSSSAEGTLDVSTDSPAVSDSEGAVDSAKRLLRSHAKKALVRDGELFVKRNAIRVVSMGKTSTHAAMKESGARYAQWFIFAKSATQLEDWYHAILAASALPEGQSGEGPDLIGPVFSNDDMANLLVSLDSVPDPIPLRWLNAMVGRIFFSIYKTAWLEDYIKAKFRKKMSRVRTPGFLSDIRIRDVDLGSTPPAFSRPMLKSLTGDGEASMEVEIHYRGALRLTISTVLTISLGQRFKQYNVTLVLAVILNSLEGNLLLHIKPPPSNRLWFGFTKLPKMDISVEPVVSERKVQWSMVKRLIESRIRELLTESLVLPNMDDIPFFDTRDYDHRGGIWADAGKQVPRVDIDSTVASQRQQQTGPPTAEPDTVGSQSKSTPASVLNVPVGQDGETTSVASSIDGNTLDNRLRNRRPLGGDVDVVTNNSEPALVAPSPAVAGLSSLLARDQAASSLTGGSSSGGGGGYASGGSGASSQGRRAAWFAGSKLNGAKGQSSKSLSGVRRSGQPKSSLAWGSASLERPGTNTDAEPLSAAAAVVAHERNKESINSLSSVDAGSHTDETDDVEDSNDVNDGDGDDDGEDTIDGPVVHSVGETQEGGVLESSAKTALEGRDSLAAEGKNEGQSAEATAMGDVDPPTLHERTLAPPPVVPPRPIAKTPSPTSRFAPPPQRSARSPSSKYATSTHSQNDGVEQQRAASLAAQSLASLQRERYGVSSNGGGNADETQARAAMTSAALLSTWNKAKASVADRDSRQAAAKEAKDAIKRGWASWNARRSVGPQPIPQRDDLQNSRMDAIMTSSDRLGEVSRTSGGGGGVGGGGLDGVGHWEAQQQQQRETRSRTSSWIASSPEDPASLGAGLDGLSSSPSLFSLGATAATGDTLTTASDNVKDEHGTAASSRASSVSGRKPYHEHRADRLTRRGIESTSRPSSRASSLHRSESRPSTPPPALPVNKEAEQSPKGGEGGAWDAMAPGLTTPLPIAQREASQERRSQSHQQQTVSSSPSTIRRAVNTTATGSPSSASQATIGNGGGEGTSKPTYSFVPGQPTATIGLTDVILPAFPKQQQQQDTSVDIDRKQRETSGSTAPANPTTTPTAVERRPSTVASDATMAATQASAPPPKGIKQQPTRAAMMAVPGIPSMQKATPQSFEAPAPTPPTTTMSEASNTAASPRLGIGNLISRIPSFSSVSGAPSTSTAAMAPASDGAVNINSARKSPQLVAAALATSSDVETVVPSTTANDGVPETTAAALDEQTTKPLVPSLPSPPAKEASETTATEAAGPEPVEGLGLSMHGTEPMQGKSDTLTESEAATGSSIVADEPTTDHAPSKYVLHDNRQSSATEQGKDEH